MKLRRKILESDSSEDEISPTKKKTVKPPEKKETLMDMINLICSDGGEDINDLIKENKEDFAMNAKSVLKDLVLNSSSEENINKDTENDEEKPQKNKRKLSTSSEEIKKNLKKRFVLSDLSLSDSDNKKTSDKKKITPKKTKKSSDSTLSDSNIKKTSSSDSDKKKKKKFKRITGDDSSSSSCSIEFVSQESKSPGKGRKNIKKLMKKDALQVETIQAVKAEEQRKQRLKEREKKFKTLFGANDKKLILDFDDDGDVLLEVSLFLFNLNTKLICFSGQSKVG